MKVEGVLERELELAHGLIVKDKEYKQFTIREVVGTDEEAISQPIYKKNPIAMYLELIHRCIVEVTDFGKPLTKNELKSLPVGTLDELMLQIRLISIGPDYDLEEKCSNKECNYTYKANYNLEDLEIRQGSREKKITLPRGFMVGEKKIKEVVLTYPNGFTQEGIVKSTPNLTKDSGFTKFGELNTTVVLGCIKDASKQGIDPDIVKAMTRADRRAITEAVKESPGPVQSIELECPECEEKIRHVVNLLDFLV